MSYRFIWKKIASKAVGSAVAKALLTVNTEEMWQRLARTESLSEEQVEQLQKDIDARLQDVEEAGRNERDLVMQVAMDLASRLLKGRGGK